jgi:hypothetical protein
VPIAVSWYDPEHTTLQFTIRDSSWSWDDIRAALDHAVELTDDAPPRADGSRRIAAIVHFLQPGPLPRDIFQQLPGLFSHIPDRWGCVAIVQQSLFVRTIVRTAARLYPVVGPRLLLAHTLAEAESILAARKHDPHASPGGQALHNLPRYTIQPKRRPETTLAVK